MIFNTLEVKNYHIFSSMNTNHICKNNELSDKLNEFMKKNINLAHIKLISFFITALCKAKTVCFSMLSACFDHLAKADSCLRRIQRFFSKYTLSPDLIARVIHRLLPMKGPYRLAIDRTNWKFGKTDINIFMPAIVHDGVAKPYPISYPHSRELLDSHPIESKTSENLLAVLRSACGASQISPQDLLCEQSGLLPVCQKDEGQEREAGTSNHHIVQQTRGKCADLQTTLAN